MLLGNNIALVVYGIFMAILLEPLLLQITSSGVVILIAQTIISTLVVIFIAEFLPKAAFGLNPNIALKIFAFPLIVFYVLLILPSLIIIGLSQLLLKLFANIDFEKDEISFGRIDLNHYLQQVTDNSRDEQKDMDHEIYMFQNALDFSNIKARECMVPRTEIVAVEKHESIPALRDKFIETGLSKILVYKDNIDNIIGYAHSYDLFKQPEMIRSILLPVLIIPEAMAANEILKSALLRTEKV